MGSEIQDSRVQNAAGALATQFEAKPNWHGRSAAGCNQEAFTAKPQSRKDRKDRKGAQGEEREIGDWLLGKRDR